MKKSILAGAAGAGLAAAGFAFGISMGVSAHETPAENPHANDERCYGLVKAGHNDCGANAHACGGHATVDGDPNEWLYMPQGLCERLVGASLTAGSPEAGTEE